MNIVYLGSGEIGLPTLRTLLQAHASGQHKLVAVVTQPDRPVGRHLTLTPGAIKILAQDANVPVVQPERIRRPEAVEAMRALEADVFVVFAYGQILPPAILAAPRLACLNLHASLLPRYRGAAPIHAAVLGGERESGLTVMYMDAGLDTGDILRAYPCRLRSRETAGSLHDRLAELAPAALMGALDELAIGDAPRQPQESSQATYAPKLERASGRIDWTRDSLSLDRFIRGMHPWPGAFTSLPAVPRSATLKIHSALPVRRLTGAPGEIVGHSARGVFVAAGGGGGLLLREVQLEGKRRLAAADFARGYALPVGLRFG